MAVPMEWLEPGVGYQMRIPTIGNVWDGTEAFTITGPREFYLEQVRFSEFEKAIFEQLGSDRVHEFLPEGCYGEYRLVTEWGRISLKWTRLYLSEYWATEYVNEAGVIRARQEAH